MFLLLFDLEMERFIAVFQLDLSGKMVHVKTQNLPTFCQKTRMQLQGKAVASYWLAMHNAFNY